METKKTCQVYYHTNGQNKLICNILIYLTAKEATDIESEEIQNFCCLPNCLYIQPQSEKTTVRYIYLGNTDLSSGINKVPCGVISKALYQRVITGISLVFKLICEHTSQGKDRLFELPEIDFMPSADMIELMSFSPQRNHRHRSAYYRESKKYIKESKLRMSEIRCQYHKKRAMKPLC